MGAGAQGVIRRDNPAARLHKQRIAKGLAQTVQGMADCRLADAQPNRSPRNAALIQHGNKRGQRPQVNIQYINGFHGSKFRAGMPLSHRCKNRNASSTKISKARKKSAKAGVGVGFPKMCGAKDGGAQAPHGGAEGAFFGKPTPTPADKLENPKSPKFQSDRAASHSANSSQEARGALLPARIPMCPPGATRNVLSTELT